MCRAVRGEGQHVPRIPVEESHQGASGKSIVLTDSPLSFRQILLQILKTCKCKRKDCIILQPTVFVLLTCKQPVDWF